MVFMYEFAAFTMDQTKNDTYAKRFLNHQLFKTYDSYNKRHLKRATLKSGGAVYIKTATARWILQLVAQLAQHYPA